MSEAQTIPKLEELESLVKELLEWAQVDRSKAHDRAEEREIERIEEETAKLGEEIEALEAYIRKGDFADAKKTLEEIYKIIVAITNEEEKLEKYDIKVVQKLERESRNQEAKNTISRVEKGVDILEAIIQDSENILEQTGLENNKEAASIANELQEKLSEIEALKNDLEKSY